MCDVYRVSQTELNHLIDYNRVVNSAWTALHSSLFMVDYSKRLKLQSKTDV